MHDATCTVREQIFTQKSRSDFERLLVESGNDSRHDEDGLHYHQVLVTRQVDGGRVPLRVTINDPEQFKWLMALREYAMSVGGVVDHKEASGVIYVHFYAPNCLRNKAELVHTAQVEAKQEVERQRLMEDAFGFGSPLEPYQAPSIGDLDYTQIHMHVPLTSQGVAGVGFDPENVQRIEILLVGGEARYCVHCGQQLVGACTGLTREHLVAGCQNPDCDFENQPLTGLVKYGYCDAHDSHSVIVAEGSLTDHTVCGVCQCPVDPDKLTPIFYEHPDA